MKTLLFGVLIVFGFLRTAHAQLIDVKVDANGGVRVENLGCDKLEYTKLELISRNTVISHCRPILCKIRPRAYFLGSNSDFEITRFDGDQSVYITQAQHKNEMKNKVQELIDEKVCKTFQIFELPAGKWPGKNTLW